MKLPGNGTVEFSGSEHSHIASTQIQGNSLNSMDRVHNRNFSGQESGMIYSNYSKKKICQPITLYLAKLSFKNEGEIKIS